MHILKELLKPLISTPKRYECAMFLASNLFFSKKKKQEKYTPYKYSHSDCYSYLYSYLYSCYFTSYFYQVEEPPLSRDSDDYISPVSSYQSDISSTTWSEDVGGSPKQDSTTPKGQRRNRSGKLFLGC